MNGCPRPWLAWAVVTLAATIAPALPAADLPPGVRLIDGYIPRFAQKAEKRARSEHEIMSAASAWPWPAPTHTPST